MKLKYTIIVVYLCTSCSTLSQSTDSCSLGQYSAMVNFVGEADISGKLFKINQYKCPGLGALSGEIDCLTSFGIYSESQKVGADLMKRPFMLEADDVLIINDWLMLDFIKSLPSNEDSEKIVASSDGLINNWIENILTVPDTTIYSSRQGIVRYSEIDDLKAYIYSADRCLVKNQYFRGLNIFWSDNKSVNVAILLPKD